MGKKFIALSFGVESTTMAFLYGKGATGLWCDTGAEHHVMYERVSRVEAALKEIHNGDFEIIKLKGDYPAYGRRVDGLEETVKTVKYMPSGQARYCTKYFKIFPIDDFLQEQGECELMIGFYADEDGRTGNLGMKANVSYTYPLIRDGLTRADCEDVLRLNGLHPNFPVYMLRGGCRMCFFKTEKEYKALYHLNRKEFNEMVDFEEQIQDSRRKFYSIMNNGKSLRQLATECGREKLLFDDIETLYKSLKKETSCGAFCHR